jgi:hypothetical protein
MQSCFLTVTRQGRRWAVSADGELLAFARRKRDAQHLARETAETLCKSGFHAEVVAGEPRSFHQPEDGVASDTSD